MKKQRIISWFLAVAMLLPGNLTALAWDRTAKEAPNTQRVEQLRDSGLETLQPADPIDPAEEITAIVVLETQPVVVTDSTGGRKVKNKAALLRQQKNVQKAISAQVLDGAAVEVLSTYTAVTSGFSIRVPYGKLEEIRALDGVASAYPAPVFQVAPDMETSSVELGGLENTSGYQGEGMVIAIVDSGLEITHPLFRTSPTDPALTQKDVAQVLTSQNLKAEEKVPGITATQVYRSGKVPFAFDYADNDTDAAPGNAGDHGTHVAGIAAGNRGVASDVAGIAPQAQILAMKVFSSYGSNGATWDDILAAADDAVSLGADVINMSLGSTCGFSTPEGDEGVAEVFQRIVDAGVMLSISAGNEYSAALGTRIGKGHALTSNPDYGTVASPSSYTAPLSVASVEKAATIDSYYFTAGARKVAFHDTAEDSTASGVDAGSKTFRSLAGKSLEYVIVPGFGESADYQDLDVRDKIALVSRGNVNYQDKKEAAKAAGAAGMVVYNNEPGLLYMQLDEYDLPTAFISQADGTYLLGLAAEQRKLTVSALSGTVENPTSGEMSDFSSWGVTPELTLKPDITAPGGNIKSATVGGGYTTKSGTSMSAPFVSGAMAIVKQYVEQKDLAESAVDKAELVSDLLMSTADLVMAGTAPYSPRKQGAGSVNIAAATSAKAYLTAMDGTRPKLALGDDPGKNGMYELRFLVHSLAEEELTYTLGGYIQTDGKEVTKQLGGKDVTQVTELPYLLGRIAGQTVTVPAGGTAEVTVTVTLDSAAKEYLNTFENGTYVEGFVTLASAPETQPTLSIPYMAFYGDWTQAPIVDAGDYTDLLSGRDSWAQAYVNTAASSSLEGTVYTYLGDNPYHEDVSYLADRNAISPNDDGYMDSLSFVYTGLLRNVRTLKYEIASPDGSEVYYSDTVDYETKSVYSSNYYQILPSGASDYNKFQPWYGTKKDGYSKLKNNDKAVVTITGELAYEGHAANNVKDSWVFLITIDTEEPEARDITVSVEDGKYYVTLSVTDNQYVSNVTVTNNAESKELASFPVAADQAGAVTECRYDITGFGENLKLVVNDYACNRKVYPFTAEGNTDASEVIVPTKSVFFEDFEGSDFPPEGWSLTSQAAKTWYQGTEYGSRMAMVDLSKTEQQNEWLITPAIDLSAQTTRASMVFDFYTNYYWSVQNHHHNLKVMATADGGVTWTQIWQLWDWNQKNEFGAWEKTQAKVTIPDAFQSESAVKFAFVYEGKDSTSLWLDNVQVYVEDPSTIHTITASAGEGGKIDPAGAVQINDGKSKTFTITPDAGYFLSDVKVDGQSVGPKTSYTFTSVKEDHTIAATFGGGAAGETELLIDEDFNDCTSEGALPDGWTATGAPGSSKTWYPYTYPSAYSTAAFQASLGAYRTADWNYSGAESDRLLAPVVDLTGRKSSLSFRFVAGKYYLNQGEFSCILEATTDGTTWTQLWSSADAGNRYASADESGYQVYTEVSVLIPEELQTSNVQFAFRYEKKAGGSGPCCLDNIKLIATKASSGGGEESTLLDEDFNDFEGSVPTDWTIVKKSSAGGSYTWQIKKSYSQIGAVCSADYDSVYETWGAGQDEYLITPALDLSGKNSASMTFQFSGKANGLSENVVVGKTTVTLEASTDGGTTWNPIWNAYSISKELKSNVLASFIETADAAVSIPAEYLTANVKFAFRYQTANRNTGGCTVFVDNVKLTAQGGGTPTPPAEETFTITASALQGGSIAPSGAVTVKKGESKTFAITPSEGYTIADVTVDGESVGKVSSYTFENVTEAHTIAASFAEKPVVLPDSIHEDFNSSEELPAGWTVEGPSAKYFETWKIGRYTALNRSNAALCAQNVMFAQEQNEKLILPQINMGENMTLSFDFGGSYAELSSGSIRFTVKATLDKGQNWTVLWDAQDHLPAVDEDSAAEDITGQGTVAIPAAFCAAETQFAFVFESSDRRNGSVAVDNVVLAAGTAPAPEYYGITVAPMEHGTVTADRSLAAQGDTVALTVTPEEGYRLVEGSLMANDTVVTDNTFRMPGQAVTVTALFEQIPETPDTGSYRDGVYTGTATGNGGTVTVTVTVENGKISKIEAEGPRETPSYWERAKAIISNLLNKGNDADVEGVDTVSGATRSSSAIKEAVQDALRQAAGGDPGIFDGGNGTRQTPWRIESVETLFQFAEAVNGGEDYDEKYVVLGCSLDLSGETWTPIGTADHGKYTGFAGTFDGQGYTVSHITCGTSGSGTKYEATGFFGVVDGGTVKNLNVQIDKFYNSADGGSGSVAMGGIAGILARKGVIDHCSVTGGSQVLSEASGPKAAVGGLAGILERGGLIANSWTDVGLSYGYFGYDAEASMGGICGKQEENSLIANCASFGPAAGMVMTGKLRVGGLAGYTAGAIFNSYASGLTKANVMGEFTSAGTVVNNEASTAVGHLTGASATGAALYNCYYDKNADQMSNVDLAGDPAEGKTERRQATGWDNGTDIKTDETFISGETATYLASDTFAGVLNENRKGYAKQAADAYFTSKDLLTDSLSTWEDALDDGYLKWAVTGDRVLFGDEAPVERTVEEVELLQRQTVPFGTAKSELTLPETVRVTLSDGKTVSLPVTWTCARYDGSNPGIYTFAGTLTLRDGITNPQGLLAYVEVKVEEGEDPDPEPGPDQYSVTVYGGYGSGRYIVGDLVTIQAVQPGEGYAFTGWTARGAVLEDASALTTSFRMPAGDVTVTAGWKKESGDPGDNDNPGGGSGSGGTVSGPKYDITAPGTLPGGSVTVSPDTAARGTRVTITVEPDAGYVLDKLMVTDSRGNLLGLTNRGSGEFAFAMPASDVTVEASFVRTGSGSVGTQPIFADVPAGSYCFDAVDWAVDKGITYGLGSGLFGTDGLCTRGQIVTFLWRAAGSPEPRMTFNPFRDVAADAYYYKAVLWAVENGITSGLGDGRFAPEATCTRGQSVTFLYRAAGSPASGGSSFADVPAGAYCASAVAWAVENGITQGTGAGMFSPEASCTRGQIVTLLYRMYGGK